MIDYGYGVALDNLDRYEQADKLLEWRNNQKIFSWCRQNDLLTKDAHSEWLRSLMDRKDVRMYSILKRQANAENVWILVGVCGFTSIDLINRRAEFSLYIGPEHQGQGAAKAALKTLISHGFDNFGLNIVWGESFDGNPAAQLFEKVGFVKEGTRRDFYFRNGKFLDAHLYSIKADEWYRQSH